MGYINYIGIIPKEKYDKIKDFSKEELFEYNGEEEDGYVSTRDLSIEELYEFGKNCDFKLEDFAKPFFSNEELQESYNSDTELLIVGKEFLKEVIEEYTGYVQENYKKLIDGINGNNPRLMTFEKAEELYKHVRGMSIEWLQLTPYNLESENVITTSWKYEYVIFELVRIYKTFDFDNDILVYYGG